MTGDIPKEGKPRMLKFGACASSRYQALSLLAGGAWVRGYFER